MKIARVFPRKTTATPDDELVFLGYPPEGLKDIDEVHVSVTFSWDKAAAEYLASVWTKKGFSVKIGGPAYGKAENTFTPGM